jgi:uncharacterized protein YqeY
MFIKDQLDQDRKQAMRDKDKILLSTIRMIIDRIQKKEKDLQATAEEADVIALIQTFKKQTEETLEGFTKRGDTDQVAHIQQELIVINKYLPTQMSKEQVFAEVTAIIAHLGSPTKGELMQVCMKCMKGRADNKTVNEVVTELTK